MELLVAASMASIVIAAAVSTAVAIGSRQRRSERVIEAQTSSVLAAATLESQLSNAGYRWPSAAFAVRHVNAVDSSTSLASVSATAPITTAANCNGASVGLVEGTDVIEVAQGYPHIGPGSLVFASVTGATATVRLGGITEPFSTAEVDGSPAPGLGSVLMFVGSDSVACVGRVTALSRSGVVEATVDLLDRTFEPLAAGGYTANCPRSGMRAFRLGSRTRFMICGSAGAAPSELALYRQSAGPGGAWSAPELVERGVEDLQVSARYLNPAGRMAATGTGTSCVGSICQCDDTSSPSCTLGPDDLEPRLSTLDTNPGSATVSRVALLRGLTVELSAVSARTRNSGANDSLRAAIFDHAGSGTGDDLHRQRQRLTLYLDNLGVAP